MSVSVPEGKRKTERPAGRITPVRILSAVAVLLVLFIIFAPQARTDVAAMYSSYGTGAGGTRALYEVLGRIGFTMSRNEKPLTSPLDTASTYVLIAPSQPLTTVEELRLLHAVRHGMTLIFTSDNEQLADSLGFKSAPPPDGFSTLSRTMAAGGNPGASTTRDPRTMFQIPFPIGVTVTSKSRSGNQAFLWLDPPLIEGTDSVATEPDSVELPSLVLGHQSGRGYAIAIAPSPIVMNQLVRDPHARAAIATVRAIQFANSVRNPASRSNKVIFDEYHHGFGPHADMPAAVEHALAATPIGRVTLEAIAASLILLLSFAVRPLAPLPVPPVSRRSPLEHVGALAHAYSQVDAKRLGANRLVRGLRRRHSLGLAASLPDSNYLSALRIRIPGSSADVDRLAAALTPNSPDSPDHFATTGAVVANIERAFQE